MKLAAVGEKPMGRIPGTEAVGLEEGLEPCGGEIRQLQRLADAGGKVSDWDAINGAEIRGLIPEGGAGQGLCLQPSQVQFIDLAQAGNQRQMLGEDAGREGLRERGV
jgi:hypothetical protein